MSNKHLRKVFQSDIPDDVFCFAIRLMNSKDHLGRDKFEYADNLRIAKITDSEQTKQYQKAFNKGCCGYFDILYQREDLELYLVGFNYGH